MRARQWWRRRATTEETNEPSWPADPDQVPLWRIWAEARSRLFGYKIPPYRTRRQFEDAAERCRQRLQPETKPVMLITKTVAEPRQEFPLSRDRALLDIVALLGNGPIESMDTLSIRWGVAKSTVTRWVRSWLDANQINVEVVADGRRKRLVPRETFCLAA